MGKLKAALVRISFHVLALGACAAAPTPAPTAPEVTLAPSLNGALQPVSAPERGRWGQKSTFVPPLFVQGQQVLYNFTAPTGTTQPGFLVTLDQV